MVAYSDLPSPEVPRGDAGGRACHPQEGTEIRDAPLVAKPPLSSDTESDDGESETESEAAKESSPVEVQRFLEEAVAIGDLDNTTYRKLLDGYTRARAHLDQRRERETRLLEQAKALNRKLEEQRNEINKADHNTVEDKSEVGEVRRELLKTSNELAISLEREQQNEELLDRMRLEKQEVEKEIEKVRQKRIIYSDAHIKSTQNAIEERRDESEQLKQTIHRLGAELATMKTTFSETESRIEELRSQAEAYTSSFAVIEHQPMQLMKQNNITEQSIKSLKSEYERLQQIYEVVETETQNIVEKQGGGEELHVSLSEEQEALLSKKDDLRRQESSFMTDLRLARDELDIQYEERAALTLGLKQLKEERRVAQELHMRKNREKNSLLRALRRREVQLQNMISSEPAFSQKKIEVQIAHNIYEKAKDKGAKELKEVNDEITLLRQEYQKKNYMDTEEKRRLAQTLKEKGAVEEEHVWWVQRTMENDRISSQLVMERDTKKRDLQRAFYKDEKLEQDIKFSNVTLMELKKKLHDSTASLREYASMYDVVKNERQKYHNLILSGHQHILEMREKTGILKVQVEVLQQDVLLKDHQLEESKCASEQMYAARDSVRGEVNKITREYQEKRTLLDHQLCKIENLNSSIRKLEDERQHTMHRYEGATHKRNATGVTLIEYNNELCRLYEKVNVQKEILNKGEFELLAREDEIRLLRLKEAELNREIELAKKQSPRKQEIDNELVNLQIELSGCRDQCRELEVRLEDPANKSRFRTLLGADPSREDLIEKAAKLEDRLVDKEERRLEKMLIYDESNRLYERLHDQVENGKQNSLLLSKKVNGCQAEIKKVTRNMMAMVSELTMYQANALRLEQGAVDLRDVVREASERWKRGEPPTDEALEEWLMMERHRCQRIGDCQQKKQQHLQDAAGGWRTMAEPRPNAYIPESEDMLPLPKPYGNHAPFKPSDRGANMRHIRKPVRAKIDL